MRKVLQFPDLIGRREEDIVSWEEIVEAGCHVYVPVGMPPPEGVCPNLWAALAIEMPEEDAAEVIDLVSWAERARNRSC